MTLVIDNYDSFTYNLVQYFGILGEPCVVRRNDSITVDEAESLAPDAILISPGPGRPEVAALSLALIRCYGGRVPILGICLGHQALAFASGAHIVAAERPVHGKVGLIRHGNRGVFEGLPNPLRVTRYHSLVVDPKSLPTVYEVTAWTEEGEIMGIRHRSLDLEGLQFHPEALLTDCGLEMLARFIRRIRE